MDQQPRFVCAFAPNADLCRTRPDVDEGMATAGSEPRPAPPAAASQAPTAHAFFRNRRRGQAGDVAFPLRVGSLVLRNDLLDGRG
jgi:hypothetical protein